MDWCETCKHNETERDSMFPCIVCERAYDNAPTKWESNDYVRVVRCKDCRWFKSMNEKTQWGYCNATEDDDARQYDDFCSYGKRKSAELVHCRDCVWYEHDSGICTQFEHDELFDGDCGCNHGKRRDKIVDMARGFDGWSE